VDGGHAEQKQMSQDTTFIERAKEKVKKRPKTAAGISLVAALSAFALPMQEAIKAKAQAERNSDHGRAIWRATMDNEVAINNLSNQVVNLQIEVDRLKNQR
jgi:TolA-binding protein